MSLSGFYTATDRARALAARPAEAEERRTRAAALRRKNELATAELTARLPFTWLVGKCRPRYRGPCLWERGPAALHIQLLQPVQLDRGQASRPAGDWLCMASLDTSTGELRYEPETAPHELQHSDGTGGPGAIYYPAPTCKKCLARAAKFSPGADGAPLPAGTDGKG